MDENRYFGTDDLLPMWVADMDFKTPDFIVEAIRKRMDHEILGYSLKPNGLNSAIITWLKERHHWNIDPDWISTVPGVVSALNFAVLAFTEPGEKVIIQTPVYHPFFTAIRDHDREIVINQLTENNGNYTMDLDNLESLIDKKTKLLLLCNPHNPVGRVWSKNELKKLGDICVKHHIIILSDEIHSDLILPGNTHIPMASISEEISSITITTMAASKTFNVAGLASSFVVTSNPVLKKQFEKLPNSFHISSLNIFGTLAMESAYTYGQNWLEQLLNYLLENLTLIEQFFSNNELIKPVRPQGTYMIWLDCRRLQEKVNDLKVFFTNKAKTGLNYGNDFGPGGDGFMRLNFGCTRKTLLEGLTRIQNSLNQL